MGYELSDCDFYELLPSFSFFIFKHYIISIARSYFFGSADFISIEEVMEICSAKFNITMIRN